MRGSRVKALRRWFMERYGRSPAPAEWNKIEGGWEVKYSEFRKAKNMYKLARYEAKGQMLRPSQAAARIEKPSNS